MEGPDELLARVERHLADVFGPDTGRASVTFLGAEPIEILRFGPDADGLVRYVTRGMSRTPMGDPAAMTVDATGPRAELVLSVRGRRDTVARRLAVLAAVPAVEGVPVTAGAALAVGEPLWDGSSFTAVLVGEAGGLVDDLAVAPGTTVRFLPLLPMTPDEAAFKRAHGAAELRQRWLADGCDLRDPDRPPARL
ncbi:MAG: suppressor of fused domain protein [Frankia sp.]